MQTEIPTRSWQHIAMELLKFNVVDYAIISDYFSELFELEKIGVTSSKAIKQKCKAHFSRHGIPNTVTTDQGRQFTSEKFGTFASTWKFMHKMSSLYHHQLNGKAENSVKTAKRILKKCNEKVHSRVLLIWRNSPSEGFDSSPVELTEKIQ